MLRLAVSNDDVFFSFINPISLRNDNFRLFQSIREFYKSHHHFCKEKSKSSGELASTKPLSEHLSRAISVMFFIFDRRVWRHCRKCRSILLANLSFCLPVSECSLVRWTTRRFLGGAKCGFRLWTLVNQSPVTWRTSERPNLEFAHLKRGRAPMYTFWQERKRNQTRAKNQKSVCWRLIRDRNFVCPEDAAAGQEAEEIYSSLKYCDSLAQRVAS